MTLRCSRNNGPFTEMAEAFYTMKEFWKANGGTKFYTVEASGDGGGGSYSLVSDIITSFLGTSGVPVAGGLNNASSWFVLEEPDGTRQWVFQRATGTTHNTWYIKYSRTGMYVRHGSGVGGDTITDNGDGTSTLTIAAAPFTADIDNTFDIEISGASNPADDGVFPVVIRTGGSITYTKVSVGGGFLGDWGVAKNTTTATVRPTASDEESFMDSGPSANLPFAASGTFYMQTVVEGDTAEDDCYPGWMLLRYITSGLPFGCLMFNCVSDASAIPADSDKMVYFATEANALDDGGGAYLQFTNSSAHNWCFMRHGEADEAFVRAGGLTYHHTAVTVLIPDVAGPDPETGDYPLLPVFIAPYFSALYRVKGQSHLWRWNPAAALTYGDTVYDGTEYWLVCDDVVLRGWPDSTGPTV